MRHHSAHLPAAPCKRLPMPVLSARKSIPRNMKRRLIYGLVVVVLAINVGIGASIYRSVAGSGSEDSPYDSLELFSFVLERVRRDYVDGQDLTYKDLVYGALKGMINTLDPHSEFLEPTRHQDLMDDTQGSFGGIGVVVSMRDGRLTVVAPMEDSPGFKAGILTGDQIVGIEGRSTERMTLAEAVKLLRGEPRTDVKISIYRPSTQETIEHTLTRSVIEVDVVKDINGGRKFELSEDKIGYIHITQFTENTAQELDRALKRLKEQGMEGLILDVRWNPGGLLDQAVAVCSRFLPRGELVVTTEGRSPMQDKSHFARGRGETVSDDVKVVVLVNPGSASASEIVAGCLQDLRKAVVIGEQTFGKGSVQSILPLKDGSALRLTTAKYYTPSHKVIHERGITPDIIVPMTPMEERDVRLQRTPGGVDTLPEEDRERVSQARDEQLERARDLLKGMLVVRDRSLDWLKPDSKPDTDSHVAQR